MGNAARDSQPDSRSAPGAGAGSSQNATSRKRQRAASAVRTGPKKGSGGEPGAARDRNPGRSAGGERAGDALVWPRDPMLAAILLAVNSAATAAVTTVMDAFKNSASLARVALAQQISPPVGPSAAGGGDAREEKKKRRKTGRERREGHEGDAEHGGVQLVGPGVSGNDLAASALQQLILGQRSGQALSVGDVTLIAAAMASAVISDAAALHTALAEATWRPSPGDGGALGKANGSDKVVGASGRLTKDSSREGQSPDQDAADARRSNSPPSYEIESHRNISPGAGEGVGGDGGADGRGVVANRDAEQGASGTENRNDGRAEQGASGNDKGKEGGGVEQGASGNEVGKEPRREEGTGQGITRSAGPRWARTAVLLSEVPRRGR